MHIQLLPINCPSVQAKQVPFKGEQQKSFCLPMDSLDWETFQGNRIKALDLLPTEEVGFFHPLIAAGSSLKPKGSLCHLHQNVSLHSQQPCTALPTSLGVTKKNGQEFSGWPHVSHGLPTRITIEIWLLTRKLHSSSICHAERPMRSLPAQQTTLSWAARGLGGMWTPCTRPWFVPREKGSGWRLRGEEEG